MARVLPVPKKMWDRLYDVYLQHLRHASMNQSSIIAQMSTSNFDTLSESVLVGRREKLLEEAEKAGADVWDFSVEHRMKHPWKGSGPEKGPKEHYYFIAVDEVELDMKISLMEVMSI